jgi:hypothetical protein
MRTIISLVVESVLIAAIVVGIAIAVSGNNAQFGRFVNDTSVMYCVHDSSDSHWYCSKSPIETK